MMVKIKVIQLFSLLVLLSAVSHLHAADMIDPLSMVIPSNLDGSRPSDEDIQRAILWACKKRGWSPVVMEKGNIKASILVRSKHFVEIGISYDSEQYSISYISSRNMKYDETKKTIHRNYNKWINLLSQSIQRGFEVRAQSF